MHFPRGHIKLVYEYIRMHDGQTLLIKNISRDTGVGQWTVSRDIKWLKERNLIEKDGKTIRINYE